MESPIHNPQRAKLSTMIVRKSTTIIVITVFSILLFECIYRVTNRLAPNLLKPAQAQGLDYGDTWRAEGFGPGGSLKENFDAPVLDPYGNTVRWKNNAQGFRNDYDVSAEPRKGVIRLISIGDSFTAGYRLAQNETFSFLLEQYLNNKSDGNRYEVLISAVDDPTAALDYLNSTGFSFKPQMVLLGVTLGNDIAQAYVGLTSGGKYTLNDETGDITINASQTLGFAHGLEKLTIPETCFYPSSFLDRRSITYHVLKQLWRRSQNGEVMSSWYDKERPKVFDPVHGLGFYLKDPPREVQESYHHLLRTLRGSKKAAESRGYDLVVVVFPQRFQVQAADWTFTVAEYRLNRDCFDLTLPNRMIADFCAQNEITCIDTTPAMVAARTASEKSLYLPQGDMHPNAEGNRVIFEAIRDEVDRQLRKGR